MRRQLPNWLAGCRPPSPPSHQRLTTISPPSRHHLTTVSSFSTPSPSLGAMVHLETLTLFRGFVWGADQTFSEARPGIEPRTPGTEAVPLRRTAPPASRLQRPVPSDLGRGPKQTTSRGLQVTIGLRPFEADRQYRAQQAVSVRVGEPAGGAAPRADQRHQAGAADQAHLSPVETAQHREESVSHLSQQQAAGGNRSMQSGEGGGAFLMNH